MIMSPLHKLPGELLALLPGKYLTSIMDQLSFLVSSQCHFLAFVNFSRFAHIEIKAYFWTIHLVTS